MINTILGTKKGMSSMYDQFGRQIPVTYIVADSNVVVGTKDDRVILAFGKKKKGKKPQVHFAKIAGYMPRVIKEVKIEDLPQQTPTTETGSTSTNQTPQIKIGDKISVAVFETGDLVRVSGITRGKGFAGGVKRHGFAGGPKTHGQSDRHRAPGSIGAGTTPGRVFKGKRMAGHMGAVNLTITDLEVVKVDAQNNLMAVKGSVPGAKNGILLIEKTGKAKVRKAPEVQQVVKEKEEKEETETKETKGSEEPKDKKEDKETPNPAVAQEQSKKE